jgi:hypothetical protein
MATEKECLCGATQFQFNLNDCIKFKPTEVGMRIYWDYWSLSSFIREGRNLEVDSDGWAELQLHEFMRIFGPNITNDVVETNVLFIKNVTEQLRIIYEAVK